MSGRYKPPARNFLIRFEDRPGLEVVMRPVSIGRLMDMAGLADQLSAGKAAEEVAGLFEEFARRLVSWNIDDDDDQPVPATIEGVRSLEMDLFMEIFKGWFDGMTRAPKASMTSTEPTGIDLPMTALRSVG